jgi:hypothetical protein
MFLFTAERYDHHQAALGVRLGLNGLRVSEACATNYVKPFLGVPDGVFGVARHAAASVRHVDLGDDLGGRHPDHHLGFTAFRRPYCSARPVPM